MLHHPEEIGLLSRLQYKIMDSPLSLHLDKSCYFGQVWVILTESYEQELSRRNWIQKHLQLVTACRTDV